MGASPATPGPAKALDKEPIPQVISDLGVNQDQGLTSTEAQARLAKYGPNAIEKKKAVAALMAAYGILVARIPWSMIGFIWVYNLVWLFVVDFVKLAENRRIDRMRRWPVGIAKVAEAVTCAACLS